MSRTVAALYDTRAEAELARSRLLSEVRARSPRIIARETAAAVDDLKIARADAEAYRAGLRRGGHLLVAEVPNGAPAKRIIELLEQATGAPPDEASSRQWGDAEQGIQVQLPGAAKAEEAHVQRVEQPAAQEAASAEPAPRRASTPRMEPEAEAAAAARPAEAAQRKTVVAQPRTPPGQEELRVGKRQVVRGGARVCSFTRETPAEEQVELRDEVIDVESRPCGRQLSDGDIEAEGLFKERTFEVAAMREEPVVTKSAVIREEVIVTKRVKHRTETIRDTVRRTEVEIEDLPAPAPDAPRFFTRGPGSNR